jgi:hypothetical protein
MADAIFVWFYGFGGGLFTGVLLGICMAWPDRKAEQGEKERI